MKTIGSRLTQVLMIIVMIGTLLVTVIACSKNDDVTNPPNTKPPISGSSNDDKAIKYAQEIANILAGSINLDFRDGFSLDWNAHIGFKFSDEDKKKYDWKYNIKIEGNIIASNNRNNDFKLHINDSNNKNIVSVYNKDSNLYVMINEGSEVNEMFNIKDVSLFEALRFYLDNSVDGFEDLTNLKDIDILGMSLDETIRGILPIFLQILTTDNSRPKGDRICITKVDDKYLIDLNVAEVINLIEDLASIEIASKLPEDLKIRLTIEAKDENHLDNIGFEAIASDDYMDNGELIFDLMTGNEGLFGQVNDDLNLNIPQELMNLPESSFIQTDMAGTINLLQGDQTYKKFDWKLVTKIDLFTLMNENFDMSSPLLYDNMFHFQLSHKCTDCVSACSNLVAAKHTLYSDRYQNTSIIDIAWSPMTMGTNNVVVDISIFDMLTMDTLSLLLNQLLGISINDTIISIILSSIPSQMVMSFDTNALVTPENTNSYEYDTTNLSPKLEASDIIGDILGLVSFKDGVNISVEKVKAMLSKYVGDGALIGELTISDLIDEIVGVKYGVDTINISGVDGVGTSLKYDLGHYGEVDKYNVYEKAIKYNSNGNEKLKVLKTVGIFNKVGVTAYGSAALGSAIKGNPSMYTKDIESTNGYVNLYAKNGKNYELVANDVLTLTNWEFQNVYGSGKELFVKYTYIGFDKAEYTEFGRLFGFNGLDINTGKEQNVKLLTTFFSGQSFAYCLAKAGGILSGLGVVLPEIESIFPFPASSFETKVKLEQVKPTNIELITNLKEDKTYQINSEIDTKSKIKFSIKDRSYEYSIDSELIIPRDEMGMYIPGRYNITYTNNAFPEIMFDNGMNEISQEIIIDGYISKEYKPYANQDFVVGEVGTLNCGSVIYTLKDSSIIEVNLNISNIINFNELIELGFGDNMQITPTVAREYLIKVKVDNVEYEFNIKVVEKPIEEII